MIAVKNVGLLKALAITIKEITMIYKVYYTDEVKCSVLIDANSKEEAKAKLLSGEFFEEDVKEEKSAFKEILKVEVWE